MDTIIIIIGLFIILIMTLLFNEVIELNCFGLQNNTKKNIQLRAKIEENNLINNKDEEDNVSLENYVFNINNKCEIDMEKNNKNKELRQIDNDI